VYATRDVRRRVDICLELRYVAVVVRAYEYRLFIKRQCPEATRVGGYRTWQEEFDRHVQEKESVI